MGRAPRIRVRPGASCVHPRVCSFGGGRRRAHDDAHRQMLEDRVAEHVHDTRLLLGVRHHETLEDAIVLALLALTHITARNAVLIEARSEDPSLSLNDD